MRLNTREVQIIIVATLTCTTEGFGTALQSFCPFASVLCTVFILCSTRYLHSIVEFVCAVTTGLGHSHASLHLA